MLHASVFNQVTNCYQQEAGHQQSLPLHSLVQKKNFDKKVNKNNYLTNNSQFRLFKNCASNLQRP